MTLNATWRVLTRLTSIETVGSLMYRVQFAVYMLSVVVSVSVGLFIWTTVEASGADLPVNREFIVSYYLVMAVVHVLVSTWHSEYLAFQIRQGELNAWLIRPGSYLLNLVANNLAEKLVKVAAIMPLLAIVGFFYRDQFALPMDVSRWIAFVLAVIGAAIMRFCFVTIIGSLGFWMDDNAGIARSSQLVAMVLAGQLFPLALFPAWMGGFLDWQPFRFMLSFPLELLLMDLSRHQIVTGFALQVGWLALFVSLCRFTWLRGLRAYTAVGA